MTKHIPQLNTSTNAYLDLNPGTVRTCVFNCIAEHAGERGLTHDDIERAYMRGLSRGRYTLATDSGIRARTAELVKAGLVERIPDTLGTSRTGRRAALWRLTTEGGRAALADDTPLPDDQARSAEHTVPALSETPTPTKGKTPAPTLDKAPTPTLADAPTLTLDGLSTASIDGAHKTVDKAGDNS